MRMSLFIIAMATLVGACSGDTVAPTTDVSSNERGSEGGSDAKERVQSDTAQTSDTTDELDALQGINDTGREGGGALDLGPDPSTEEVSAEDIAVAEDVESDAASEVSGDIEAPHADVTDASSDDPGPDAAQPESDSANPQSDSLLLCHVLCDKVWTSCGSYEPYGSDQDSCVQVCDAMALEGLDSLVTMSCVGDSCDESMCQVGDDTALIQPQCQEACGLFESCGLLSVIQPDNPEEFDLCVVECSGAILIDSINMPALVACAIDGLTASCDPNVMEQCFEEVGPGVGPGPGQGPSCLEICDIATSFKCPPWQGPPVAWPDPAMCLEDCQAFSEDPFSTAYTMYGCAMTSTCGGLDKCTEPPAEDSAACDALCAKAFQTCGDIGMPSPDFCTDYCTGQLMVFGANVATADALACLEADPLVCDEDPYAQVLGCLLDLGDECNTICDAMVDCPTQNSLPVEQCMPTCMAGYMNLFGAMSTAESAACIAESEGECVDVEVCLAPPTPPTCYALCDEAMMCDPSLESCTASCEAGVQAGKLGDLACEYASACAAPELCQDIEPASNPLCVDACMSAPPSVCGDVLEGCVAACTGLVTGSGISEPAFPACVALNLGSSCNVDNAYWTCSIP